MSEDLFQQIKHEYIHMTKSFKRTADFILLARERILLYSASTLASLIGVSDATIIRFCRYLGYNGYSEFKQALISALEQKPVSSLGSIPPQMQESYASQEYASIALQYEIYALKELLETLSINKITQTVDAIERSKKIYFLGLGSSSIPARSLYFSFDRLQLNCTLLDFGGNALMEKLAFCDKEDLLIATTFPRYSKDCHEALKLARTNGTFTVLISDGNSSALSLCSNLEFVISSKNPFMMYNSNVSALALCNTIVLEFCYRHSNECSRILNTITEKTNIYKLQPPQ
ncbi:MurR/RpiR family transcriptional regulator [Flavonifractor sp. An100]|uniref:MurR/RpiR family transcriptional regulator n=1 Tax=Flavonifractor sp. An100 TaxID=1965538 RepID=UPI000B38F749|nr:MurR/RpiR family transcriptional regulator [Flavonifractor sp. An100]OUQ77503.1 hypothetical protein B5E43_10360 [Flavonifractor sp. An100]